MPDPASHPSPDADRNLLFGVLCLQAGLLTPVQFAEGCSLWTGRKDQPLDRLLIEHGWLTAADKSLIDQLLARKLEKHGGDARQSLAAIAGPDVRELMQAADDPALRESLATLPHAPGYVLMSTINLPAEKRERYTLTRLHAEGGLGRVYVAHDHELNRDVALKEIRPEQAKHPEAWHRFLKEAQLTSQLEHPNIVPVYEVAKRQEGESPFYTMRLVRGQTLRDAIGDYHQRRKDGREDPLDRPRLLNAFVSICQAVGYAHSRGVIHRDLKPANVMLGGFGEVIVLDWGLAKMVGRPEATDAFPSVALTEQAQTDATLAGRVLGTPAYLAPEQAEGRTDLVDARTDVYGLGAILFEILSGRPPHDGSGTAEVLRRIAANETPRARSVEPTVAPALDAVCAKAMAKTRGERYTSAGDLAGDVQRFLVDEPVTAYREPVRLRARRWARRHRTLVTGGGVALAASVVFLAVLAFLLEGARERTDKARADAEANFKTAEEQRQRADRNFKQARSAVDDYFTTVSESKLLDVPGLEPLRKELLEKAQKYYEKFVAEAGDDPKVRGDAAAAHYRLARITDLIGSPEAAWTEYQRAVTLFDSALADDPDNPELRDGLGRCYSAFGRSQHDDGSMEEASRLLARGREVLEPLATAHPEGEAFQADLGRVYTNTALWYRTAGQGDKADHFYGEARKIQEKLVAVNPRSDEYEDALAMTDLNLGNLLTDRGQPEEALARFEPALAIEARLVAAHPGVVYYRRSLSAVRYSIGYAHNQLGHTDRVAMEYEEARTILQRLADEHPDVADYQNALGDILIGLGNLQLDLRQEDEANATWERAGVVFRQAARNRSSSPKARHNDGLAHNNLGVVLKQLSKFAESLEHEDEAIQLREPLARENPLVIAYTANLAASHNNRANALRGLGRIAEALAAYQRSRALYEPLVAAHPTLTRYRSELGIILGNIGYLQEDADRVEEAFAAHDEARAVRQGLVDLNPRVPRFQSDLALSLFCLAKVQTKLNVHRYPGPVGAVVTCNASPLAYLPFLFVPPQDTDSTPSSTAMENYNRVLKVQYKLMVDYPALPDYRADVGRTYIQIGNVWRDDKNFLEAYQQYRKAIDVWEPLVADKPKVAEYRKNLAISRMNRGIAFQDLRLALLALKDHETARDLFEKLVTEQPDDKEHPVGLAKTYNGIGLGNLSQRRYEPALEWFLKAEAAWRPLVAKEPDNASNRTNLARAVLNRGITLAEQMRHEEALTAYREAVPLHRDALALRSGSYKYRELLAKTFLKMAASQRELDRLEDAAAACRDARRLWTVQAEPLVDVAAELARCLPLVGKGKKELTDADKEQQRRYADEVVAILSDAVARGYRERSRLTNDAEFEPLRNRDDFRKLLSITNRQTLPESESPLTFSPIPVEFMLKSPKVVADLKMDAAEVEKVEAAVKRAKDERGKYRIKLDDPNTPPAEIAAIERKLKDGYEAALESTLGEARLKRLQQIQYQDGGPAIFTNAAVAEQLRLTDGQKTKIKTALAEFQKRWKTVSAELPPTMPFEERIAKREELGKEFQAKIESLLDSDQQQRLRELLGEPPP